MGSKFKLENMIAAVAIAMVVYHMANTFYLFVDPIPHQNVHLAFALVLMFLVGIQKSRKLYPLKLGLIVLALVSTGYIAIMYDALDSRVGFPIVADMIIGVILLLLPIEATREYFGPVLPVVALIFIVYSFVGYLLPEPFHAAYLPFSGTISRLSLLGGIYGGLLGISANFLFLFILLGALFQVSGATQFFVQIGKLAGRGLRGGTAMTAVVTSALMGTVTGSVSANIATTGAFTIPLMKKVGYKPEQAGAIEAAASTGGQIMPPIMGSAAFVMSGITGVPYIKIMAVALIPALLYFFTTGLYVQFQAMKSDITPMVEKIDLREMLLSAPLFIIPLLLIIILMIKGFSPMMAVSRTLLVLIALSLIRGKTRPSLRQWIEAFTRGAVNGATIGVVLALMGAIITVFTMTGLGIKLPAAIEEWSGGHLSIALAITAFVSLMMGMGMGTTAVYVLTAIVTAPILVAMGLTVLQAHFFVFYYACMYFVTPPVGTGALIASRLAGGTFLRTGFEATKAAMAGFIVPFLFLLSPILLLHPQALGSAVTGIISAIVILVALQATFCNHYIIRLSLVESAILVVISAVLIAFMATKSYVLFAAGLIVFVLISLVQLRKKKRGSSPI